MTLPGAWCDRPDQILTVVIGPSGIVPAIDGGLGEQFTIAALATHMVAVSDPSRYLVVASFSPAT